MNPLKFHAGFDVGQVAAFVWQVVKGDEDLFHAIRKGDLEVIVRERPDGKREAVVQEALRTLIDRNGRVIPTSGLKAKVTDANRDFQLIQPDFDYAERLARLRKSFGPDTAFPDERKFSFRSQALIHALVNDQLLRPLMNCAYLPVCFPQMAVDNYGRTLEDVFLEAVERSYRNQFPDRKFVNYRKGELAGKVSIVTGSRHRKLLARMAKEPVVGIYFPSPLQGFSIFSDREQMDYLPDSLLLSGALDTALAMTAYPDVLARDRHTPGLDCSANTWQSTEYSLYFKAYDFSLKFAHTDYLGYSHDNYSGGLLFLG